MIKEFRVGVKHHLNLGNYESMEVEAQVTLSVDDDFDAARVEAQRALEKLLSDTFYKQKTPSWFAHVVSKKRQVTE